MKHLEAAAHYNVSKLTVDRKQRKKKYFMNFQRQKFPGFRSLLFAKFLQSPYEGNGECKDGKLR